MFQVTVVPFLTEMLAGVNLVLFMDTLAASPGATVTVPPPLSLLVELPQAVKTSASAASKKIPVVI